MRYLVIDSASEACSVALLEAEAVVDYRHEIIGRGHAERLVPLIAELAGGGRADIIAAGCGPGSFAGVRIGVAAARALALGWQVPVRGFSTLALVAAGAADAIAAAGGGLVVVEGGHGQWFVQPFAADLLPRAEIRSLVPDEAVLIEGELVVGNRAEPFVERRGSGCALATLPDARAFLRLPAAALNDQPSPIYGRAPDAKPMAPA
ncbi:MULTISPECIES: tRNA (adenosine(37)-N6)-threonylcarbamoyltransferase complex dimerization subunit type 1 TsaB [unclassified Sphingopyxis]|jgi:tRNA threonylcarbamoyl adenosine modification protein YeaZ|uniref:tRNA (adenosine(37)-N6)-threonylcarbamoyltransferase complex dimerization subunit type 1 TsaB n=1 Tax=unclassified Sphingopyxis TaxID=2614943 RepID=UPI0006C5A62F|nr:MULTISPECIES: tRNA (adenosine(37)-N6)-threonylcarbamoyltransferase complex dimerization subunit type 1 TsaB [unclassified Sphingopyxis]USI75812.1 tRNA (adenosine(37)-N6)-threonylcarbamoyltransferase complex dimerization subunit type 1 TsaB [Sphingopyxis sp. USTB-05]GAO77650.1 tsaB protein [Sphingopyxis sp. C-1]